MVWSNIKNNDTRKLIKIGRTQNSEKYVTLLKFQQLPGITEDEIFQHDILPCHISHGKKKFLLDGDIAVLRLTCLKPRP